MDQLPNKECNGSFLPWNSINSHPLGLQFLEELRRRSPLVVPNSIPAEEALRNLTFYLPFEVRKVNMVHGLAFSDPAKFSLALYIHGLKSDYGASATPFNLLMSEFQINIRSTPLLMILNFIFPFWNASRRSALNAYSISGER